MSTIDYKIKEQKAKYTTLLKKRNTTIKNLKRKIKLLEIEIDLLKEIRNYTKES